MGCRCNLVAWFRAAGDFKHRSQMQHGVHRAWKEEEGDDSGCRKRGDKKGEAAGGVPFEKNCSGLVAKSG